MRGDRLRSLREKLGYTQDELAYHLNFGAKEIWRYENGKTEPSGDKVAKLAQFFDVTTDYLLGVSDVPRMIESKELSQDEIAVISALRSGKKYEAIKAIVGTE